MKSLTQQLSDTVALEEKKDSNEQDLKNLEQLIDEMKKQGFIKTPQYTLPLVDTIGKNYYSSLNKGISQ